MEVRTTFGGLVLSAMWVPLLISGHQLGGKSRVTSPFRDFFIAFISTYHLTVGLLIFTFQIVPKEQIPVFSSFSYFN